MRIFSKRLTAWTLVLLSIASFEVRSEETNYTFVALGPSGGYPSKVNSVYPSLHDFIWLCSDNGLYRVAYNINDRFSQETEFGHSLPGNDIYGACQYGDQYWFLTDRGLTGFTVTNNVSNPKLIEGLDTIVAYSSIATENGVFFGGENAVYTFKDGQLVPFANIPSNKPLRISNMYRWLDGGIVLFDNTGNDIWIFYPKTGMISSFVFQCPYRGEYFSRLFIDSQFNIWASMLNRGVERYDKDGNLMMSFCDDDGSLSRDLVLCFMENGEEMWVGTDGGGIDIIDRISGKRTNLSHVPDNPLSFPSSTVSNLVKGENNVVWACRNRGGVVMIHESQVLGIRSESFPGGAAESVNAVCEDPQTGDLWLATSGAGILKFDPKSKKMNSFPSSSSSSSSSSYHNIYSIAPFGEDHLAAFCVSEGVFLFDKSTGGFHRSELIDNIHAVIRNGDRVGLASLDDGSLLITSDMIYKVQPDMSYSCYPLPEGVTSGDLDVIDGTKGKYLFSHSRIFLLDTGSMALSPLLHIDGANITAATLAPDGKVWAISNDDILKINTATRTVDDSSEVNYLTGMPESIVCSMDGNIWIGCGDKINVINPSNGNHVVLDDYDGVFDNEYVPKASTVTSDGGVFMGGVNGFVLFRKDFALTQHSDYHIFPTDITLNGNLIDMDKPLVIRGKKNKLEVEVFVDESNVLRAKFYTFSVKSRNGLEENVTSEPRFTFNHFTPGKYELMVSCTTFEGKWTEYQPVLEFAVSNKWYASIWFWVLIMAMIAGGTYIGIIETRHKRSLLTKYEDHQRKLQDESQRLNFLADLSHELRTPLTLILGPLERLIKKNEPAPVDKLMSIYKNAERIRVLLNTILTAENVSGTQAGVMMETHNINRWIKNVIVNFVDEAASHGISFRFEPDNDLGPVDIDTGKCFIVISNIILNAIKISPEDSVISIGTKDLPDTGMYRIYISDEGPSLQACGIDFDRSFQETEDKSGLGVGLAYSKSIINSLGGNIGMAANAVKGSTIYFDLPKNSTTSTEQ